MGTKLRFEKSLFTRSEVKAVPKREFKFPRAWEFESDKKNYYLRLNEAKMKKLYFVKRR